MERLNELFPVYCEHIHETLEHGNLYISNEFKIAIHLCACGCGVQTVTPIDEGEWAISDNEGKITLRPSIGNFMGENPYHAHYFFTEKKIDWW